MSIVHRKPSESSEIKSFVLHKSTSEGLKRIQKAFAARYPKDRYPSLSSVLDAVLSKEAQALDSDPAYLDESIRDFERRYRRT